MEQISVIKRDGSKVPVDFEKIHKVIQFAIEGITSVSVSDVAMMLHQSMFNGITTEQIHDSLIRGVVDNIKDNTDLQYVAARLVTYKLRKQVWSDSTPPRLIDHIKNCVKLGVYDNYLLEQYSESEIAKIGRRISHSLDDKFTFAGIQTLIDKYLVKDRDTGKVFETPQFAYMCISMTLFARYPKNIREQYVIRCYQHLSNHLINLPTPIMSGVRTPIRQYASCTLIDIADDLGSIFSSTTAAGYYTARRSGIGANFGRLRAKGSKIRGGEVISTGIVPYLKLFQGAVKSCSQNGIRGGGATINVPIWNYEIEDVLVLKNNAGTDDNRVRHMDYVVQFSKLFYNRLVKNEDITLFCSNAVPGMYEAWGTDKFDEIYTSAEKNDKIKMKKKINARELFALFTKERLETGRMYLMNIDHANNHTSWNPDLAPVKMTNLCVEVLQSTTPLYHIDDPKGEIGICILSAINMLEIKDDENLKDVCDIIVRLLDALIDHQDYPVLAGKNFATKRRSLGVGITNLAAWLAEKKLNYDNPIAGDELNKFMEKMQYFLLESSCDLAKELGKCEKYGDTKYAQGLLPIDWYNKFVDTFVSNELQMDWEVLRQRIKQYGLRHSTLSCEMPVESSSVIQNSTNGIEPVRSLISYKKSKQGSIVQVVPNYKTHAKYYTKAFDMPENNLGYMNIVAIVNKWMDMGVSANCYHSYKNYEDGLIPQSVLIKEQLEIYKRGICTLYYTNTPSDGDKSVESNNSIEEKSGGCESGACAL